MEKRITKTTINRLMSNKISRFLPALETNFKNDISDSEKVDHILTQKCAQHQTNTRGHFNSMPEFKNRKCL